MLRNLTILILLFCAFKSKAQSSPVFYNLGVDNGLSYNNVNSICVDKRGNLWIATDRGLNMFDGQRVDKYFAEDHPQMNNSYVSFVTCDSNNRIWILTDGGHVSMLDEKGRFHRIALYTNKSFISTKAILNSQQGNIILFTNAGFFAFNSPNQNSSDSCTNTDFRQLHIKGFDTILKQRNSQIFYYDDDSYFFVRGDISYKINFKNNCVENKYSIPNCLLLCKWDQHELLYFDKKSNELKILDLLSNKTILPFKGLKDQHGKIINAWFFSAKKINQTDYLLTTYIDGIYIYNTETKKISNYRHEAANRYSISCNRQLNMSVGNNGWVFLVCNPNGISYFNTRVLINNQHVFSDLHGHTYDGYINAINSSDQNTFYIGTSEGLLSWKRSDNTTQFINPLNHKGEPVFLKEDVVALYVDKKDQLWVSTLSNGIAVFDKQLHLLKQINSASNSSNELDVHPAYEFKQSASGEVWVGGVNGLAKINPITFKVDNLESIPFSQFKHDYCSAIQFTDDNNIWFGIKGKGLQHYNFSSSKREEYSTKNGLTSNIIFDINSDHNQTIYIATVAGLNLLFHDGRIKTITSKDGLLIDRVDGLLPDHQNRMWIGNDLGLACYSIADSTITAFDERYGLSIYGFKVGAYFQTPSDELFAGTPRGIQYFHLDSLFQTKVILNASIYKIETKNLITNITGNDRYKLLPNDNQVTFYFSTIDFAPHVRTYYECKLIGIDQDWVKGVDQNSITYNNLAPGTYAFMVKVSHDGKHWQMADNQVTVILATPFYKAWWFICTVLLLLGFILYSLYQYDRRQYKERQCNLETELVITYFASQINSHKNVDDMLWDIAKNCISKLHFEDCIIYLIDEERNMLVQKAAYGPKNAVDYTIEQPIEIPIGKGITGSVAQSGVSEIIGDTKTDTQYILDDNQRNSEIAVPILVNQRVIGVIDSEHSKKNFFTLRHKQILATIAVLCANQYQKINAEEERQSTTIELLENKQKMTESRLQSLRLQMNPHFLFNALNSIQQMILSNEDVIATRYLSRFSKLLRTILVHSDKELITLKEEIEILSMYIELESVRFKDSFTYTLQCDDEIETEEIQIPTMLIQPFVENAIWHGLMHKEGERHLLIAFSESEHYFQCIVEDNGVGRTAAREMNSLTGRDKKHSNKGISVSEERLRVARNQTGMTGSIQIIDLKNEQGENSGTRVIINFAI